MRTFFAIDLPKDCKQSLAAYMEALQQQLAQHYSIKHFLWVKPDNLHLTLQFLGQVKEEEVEELLQKVRVVQSISSFSLTLGALEWFPSPYQPHVLSLQTQPHEILTGLSASLGRGIVAMGYPIEERPFRGHLTLARVERLQNVDPTLLLKFDLPPLPETIVKEIVFFQSELQRAGSRYTRLAEIPLSAG